jgi:thiosulfate/3-mercaptopyruvate sulfurtransferase
MGRVREELEARGPVVFLDARSGPDARQRFEAKHAPGARLVILDEDLAAPTADPRDGGRHPFPTPEAFAEMLGRRGITPSNALVVLDDRDGANPAARLYVMLKAIGHEDVSFLDGGLAELERLGAPLESGPPPVISPTQYPAKPWAIPFASMAEVEASLAKKSALVLDARSAERFRGEIEPFDPVAGHVTGAVNLPYATLLDAEGHLLGDEALRARFAELGVPAEGELIVQCGSGVTACMLLIALEEAGIRPIGPGGAKLWVGSYSEWCRNEKPIARGA